MFNPQQFIEETEREFDLKYPPTFELVGDNYKDFLLNKGYTESWVDIENQRAERLAIAIHEEHKRFLRSRLLALIEARDKELRERIEGMKYSEYGNKDFPFYGTTA